MGKRALVCIILLALLLAACTPPPAAAPTPPAPLALTETFRTADGLVTLRYPAGWYASEITGQITIATTQTAAEAASPARGQFQMRMIVGPISAINGLAADSTPRQVLEFFAQTLAGQGVTFNTPAEFTLGSYNAARLEGSSADGQGTVMAVNLQNGIYNIASATSFLGEMTQFEPTLRAILESVTYGAPDATPEPSAP
ncbi:MAG: hypothetical protein JNJ61_15410 [Anaerolineae bacterium]|nr:hypothetical protein [Anaerolineae bacterium]